MTGSPPHAGKGRTHRRQAVVRPGLTPARGEGTKVPARDGKVDGAHPRTRGRDATAAIEAMSAVGSPPHAGKGLSWVEFDGRVFGLTPARGEGTA